jgi:predicted HTH transcriptional regulator
LNLKKLILAGEGVDLDFKKTITYNHKIAKTMVAFANNKGGKILIGIMDDGTVKGVKNEEEERFMLLKAGTHFCRPQIIPKFTEHTLDGHLVLVAEIEASDVKPHYSLDDQDKWWVYVRVKDKCVLASKIVIDVLQKAKSIEPVIINFSEKEKALLEYLQANEKITLMAFCDLIKCHRRQGSKILVNLILSGIIRVHYSDKTEYYTAA